MKKIIISNGFTNFPLRFVAEGLHKKGYDVVLLTGVYPFKKLITLFKILHIDKFGPIQRIINRKITKNSPLTRRQAPLTKINKNIRKKFFLFVKISKYNLKKTK